MIENVICPDGELYPASECAISCRMVRRCVPLVYAQIVMRERIWEGKPSVTQLLNGTREMWLRIKKPYDISLQDRAFMLLGTSAHKLLEETNVGNVIFREQRLEYEGIVGTPDLVERWGNENILIDHKTSGSYMVAKMKGIVETKVVKTDEEGRPIVKNGKPVMEKIFTFDKNMVDKFEYQMQLNFYRIMLERTQDIKIDRMFNFVIVRDGGTFVAQNRGINEKVCFIEQEILPDKFVLDYFLYKRDELLKYIETDIMPPICDNRENWDFRKCENYCSCSKYCDYKNYMIGGVE